MSISELFRASGALPVSGTTKPEGVVGKGSLSAKELKGPSDFQKLLHTETNKVHLSAHAQTRIQSRDIHWDSALEKRVSSGMDQAQSKGSREALILAGDVAVIANIQSRTVVTAMDRTQLKDRIFTNIDSAVLV